MCVCVCVCVCVLINKSIKLIIRKYLFYTVNIAEYQKYYFYLFLFILQTFAPKFISYTHMKTIYNSTQKFVNILITWGTICELQISFVKVVKVTNHTGLRC